MKKKFLNAFFVFLFILVTLFATFNFGAFADILAYPVKIAFLPKKYIEKRIEEKREKAFLPGVDCKALWEGTYEICRQPGKHSLGLYIESDGTRELLLSDIKTYAKFNDKLFAIGSDGYAVIDRKNMCRIFINMPKNEYKRGIVLNENGEKTWCPGFIKNSLVTYVNDFSSFENSEKQSLNEMADENYTNPTEIIK